MPRPAPRVAPATSATLSCSGPRGMSASSPVRRVGVGGCAPATPTSTSSAASITAPPASCTALSISPKTRNASSTVTSGSSVARIEAVVASTRSRPAKNRLTAATVQTTAMHASHHQPTAETAARRRFPISAEPAVSVVAAPVQTSAVSMRGATRRETPSPTRMYVAYVAAQRARARRRAGPASPPRRPPRRAPGRRRPAEAPRCGARRPARGRARSPRPRRSRETYRPAATAARRRPARARRRSSPPAARSRSRRAPARHPRRARRAGGRARGAPLASSSAHSRIAARPKRTVSSVPTVAPAS